jgi:hypothetical protein
MKKSELIAKRSFKNLKIIKNQNIFGKTHKKKKQKNNGSEKYIRACFSNNPLTKKIWT